MTNPELLGLLPEFSADRLTLLQRDEASARVAAHYDFNNTCHYVIAREETQLTWLSSALTQMGAGLPPAGDRMPVPEVQPYRKTVRPEGFRALLDDELGHRLSDGQRVGDVLATRWVE